MKDKIAPQFRRSLELNPTQRVDVIVRTEADPRDLAPKVVEHGLLVRHTYSLIKALSASGLGLSVLELAKEPWVVEIEPDQEMRTMN